MTENSLSRKSLLKLVTQQRFCVATRLAARTAEARATAPNSAHYVHDSVQCACSCARDKPATVYRAVHYLGTVHKGTVQKKEKKEYKNDPRKLGCHILAKFLSIFQHSVSSFIDIAI